MRTILLAALCAALIAGCGGSSTNTGEDSPPAEPAAATATNTTGGGCTDAVKLDSNGNYENAAAIPETVKDTDCDTARAVLREWASQNVGGPQARLPSGWSCDGNSVCTNGAGGKVTFALLLG
jgi:hypothetical protein